MTSTPVQRIGVSREVVVAALVTTLGAIPVFTGFGEPTLPTGALFCAGWPALGLTSAVILDSEPGSRVGRTLVLVACSPALLMLVAVAISDGQAFWDSLAVAGEGLHVPLVLITVVAVGWAVGLPDDRMSRRRLAWLLVFSAALVAAVITSFMVGSPRSAAVVTTIGLWAYAGAVVRLLTTRVFRPIDEPFMDAAVVLGALLVGAATASAVRVAGLRADVPLLELSVVFAGVVAAATAWPAVLWLRRGFLQRRYGTGRLSQADMAAVTASLHPQIDPRDLLGKAALMIKAAAGFANVQLVLGDEVVEPATGWELYPLDVGGERVGVLLIDPGDPEGSEPHQERIVHRMLPMIALIARAVDLAVAAEQARQDVARQREQERTRILSDLHDGVGPQLAGMSMRVQAQLRRDPSPLLHYLAAGLASARGDLRRIVSGLTPSALHDTDLADALAYLVESFDAADRRVHLEINLGPGIPEEVAVAVYRSVAEGVANALRHGRAKNVMVRVDAVQLAIHVDICDDGVGGAIVEGVGLTSLRRRAEHLGGFLTIAPHEPSGVHLHLELPRTVVA